MKILFKTFYSLEKSYNFTSDKLKLQKLSPREYLDYTKNLKIHKNNIIIMVKIFVRIIGYGNDKVIELLLSDYNFENLLYILDCNFNFFILDNFLINNKEEKSTFCKNFKKMTFKNIFDIKDKAILLYIKNLMKISYLKCFTDSLVPSNTIHMLIIKKIDLLRHKVCLFFKNFLSKIKEKIYSNITAENFEGLKFLFEYISFYSLVYLIFVKLYILFIV